uniref:Uncharacterized protein n=1 Tax=Rhizophora mucronata TaxID=61149 RepID=A0A2P2PK71_RHIMU
MESLVQLCKKLMAKPWGFLPTMAHLSLVANHAIRDSVPDTSEQSHFTCFKGVFLAFFTQGEK